MHESGHSSAPPLQRVTAIVRVSSRVRRMRLVALPGKGLELVVTPKTTPAEMEAFLAQNAAWAARMLKRLGAPMDARDALKPALPERMELRAVGEEWPIRYVPGGARENTVRLRFRQTPEGRALEIGHGVAKAPHAKTVIGLLQRYLRDRAKHVLPPWVARVVSETGLHAPARLRVGLQRTVWGSRSANGTLSLSARLLFLPPDLVRHVIVHELCHAGHMHHRASFHRMLESHDPLAAEHREALKSESRKLPTWCSE